MIILLWRITSDNLKTKTFHKNTPFDSFAFFNQDLVFRIRFTSRKFQTT